MGDDRLSSRVSHARDLIRALLMFTVTFVAWFLVTQTIYWILSFLVSLLVFCMERVRHFAKIRFPFFATVTFLYTVQLMLLGVFLSSPASQQNTLHSQLSDSRGLRGVRSSGAAIAQRAPLHNFHQSIQPWPQPYHFESFNFHQPVAQQHPELLDIRQPQFIQSFYGDGGHPFHFSTLSVILIAFNEHQYLQRTLESIVNSTHPSILEEIIVVDDASDPPMSTAYDVEMFPPPLVKVIRHEQRQGLIRSKIVGGDVASGAIFVFLDAHVRPDPGWAIPIMKHINTNYKRVVVPTIPMLDGNTWEVNRNAVGIKMMFEWDLNFHWFDDGNDYVPCMSGGLLAISRDWWFESGTLDEGMLQWGGENIEQSIRIWLCGGEIVVARDSFIAHVFRDKFPYSIDSSLIMRNKVRTVESWWNEEFKEKFYNATPSAKRQKELTGDLTSREQIKERLNCKPFEWYVERFKDVFLDRGMLPKDTFQLANGETNLCLAEESSKAVVVPCDEDDQLQKWSWRYDGTALQNYATNKCLDAANPRIGGVSYGAKQRFPYGDATPIDHKVVTFGCEKGNHNQYWIAEGAQLTHSSFCASFPPSSSRTAATPVTLFECGRDHKNEYTGGALPVGQRFEIANHKEIKKDPPKKRPTKKAKR